MRTSGNTILITGGGTGIGLSLAEAFIKAGNTVIICGRREEKLREAKGRLPTVHTRVCDLSRSEERARLFRWATTEFRGLNVLVNNAGIQRMVDLTRGLSELIAGDDEIDINLKAPVHLTALFIPHLASQEAAAVVNISSGLGFVPMAITPVYCATKAAIHSYSLSLRYQLRRTPVRVFEVIAPTVDTDLDRGARERRGQADRGIPPVQVAEATLRAMEQDAFEVAIGRAEGLVNASRADQVAIFSRINPP